MSIDGTRSFSDKVAEINARRQREIEAEGTTQDGRLQPKHLEALREINLPRQEREDEENRPNRDCELV